MSDITIRELSENDWREYKSIRLKSLRDSPDSFGSTYEREVSFAAEQWKSRLKISSTIHDAVAFAAIADQSFIGLVSCVIHKPETKAGHLYQMWVSPEFRGAGVGTALVERVKRWAGTRDIEKLLLSVTTINGAAISLYQTIGFNSVGQTEPLRKGSNLKSQIMQISLATKDGCP